MNYRKELGRLICQGNRPHDPEDLWSRIQSTEIVYTLQPTTEWFYTGLPPASLYIAEQIGDPAKSLVRQWTAHRQLPIPNEPIVQGAIMLDTDYTLNVSRQRRQIIRGRYPVVQMELILIVKLARMWYLKRYPDLDLLTFLPVITP